MEILIDTHVHVYPFHHADRLLQSAGQRLRGWARTTDPVCVLMLTEAGPHHFFDQLAAAPSLACTIRPTPEPAALCLSWNDQPDLWLIAGRQLVTAERLEILGLAMTHTPPDGQTASATIEAVHQAGGIPVLPWSPGKWMFRRARVVQTLCDRFDSDALWLGDSSLRPQGWPSPRPMRDPTRRVLAGSDPLPFAGEEALAGTYATRIEGHFDPARPVTSLQHLLRSDPAHITQVGQRNRPWTWARRLKTLKAVRATMATSAPAPSDHVQADGRRPA